MGQYLRGDVLLASVALDTRVPAKTRPVIVISTSADGTLQVCPVSSKPPSDAPSIPITIDDFASGGLDLFEESYVMTSRVVTLRSSGVIGKRGRLTPDFFSEIAGLVPGGKAQAKHPDPKRSRQRYR